MGTAIPERTVSSLGSQVGYHLYFCMLFKCARGGFANPLASFWLPLDALGPHYGAHTRPQSEQNIVPEARSVPESILYANIEGSGPG